MSKEIILPYDFIPFAEEQVDKYYLPYHSQSLPHHYNTSEAHTYSGSIEYQIHAASPLALELRQTAEGQFYLSGSQIRGKIRSNVEQLSASYPLFVNRSSIMRYRSIKNNNRYRKLLLGLPDEEEQRDDKNIGIEETVNVGYLQRQDNGYVIIPAKGFGNKHFLSIDEYWITKNNGGLLDQSNYLFRWKKEEREFIQSRLDQIEKLSEDIHVEKTRLGEEWEQVKEEWTRLFLNEYSFTSTILNVVKQKMNMKKKDSTDGKMQYLTRNEKEKLLKDGLKCLENSLYTKLSEYKSVGELAKNAAKRWGLKAEIYLYMESIMFKNGYYEPYEKTVYYKLLSEQKVKEITKNGTGKCLKGTLYNSTNATKKRCHYLIGERNTDADPIPVSDTIMYDYNNQWKKIRFTKGDSNKLKEFYNLFPEDKTAGKAKGNTIVFYKQINDADGGVSLSIGRTPYLKVPYDYQLKDLLGPIPEEIDCARAMFGFIDETSENKKASEYEGAAYHSRLRFGPVIMNENVDAKVTPFLLSSPEPTATGMYLHPQKQKRGKTTYEMQSQQPLLNGHKYYHVLDNPIEYPENANNDNLKSGKLLIDNKKDDNNAMLTGRVYFTNLTKAELGLLLLAIDIREFNKIQEKINR